MSYFPLPVCCIINFFFIAEQEKEKKGTEQHTDDHGDLIVYCTSLSPKYNSFKQVKSNHHN